jgi:hypothetical protein
MFQSQDALSPYANIDDSIVTKYYRARENARTRAPKLTELTELASFGRRTDDVINQLIDKITSSSYTQSSD